MPERSIIVLADDLTGACEIAAIGLRKGLSAIVTTDLHAPLEQANLLVIDTETRLDNPAFAAARLRSSLDLLRIAASEGRLFKKIDSVFRGPIAAELNLLAEDLKFERIIVAAGNPALGRTIEGGLYQIHKTLLHETDFANDLHHPARSSWVVDLLGASRSLPVHRCSKDDLLPQRGIVLGDVTTMEDYNFWSDAISSKTLPAGSAPFFEAVINKWATDTNGSDSIQPSIPSGPLMLISGTTSSKQIAQLREQQQTSDAVVPLTLNRLEDDLESIQKQIGQSLDKNRRVILFMEDSHQAKSENAYVVRSTLGRLAKYFVDNGAIKHLVIEGGATAASVALGLRWTTLRTTHEWAPGIVSLQPICQSDPFFMTIKPGSYPWPPTIRPLLFGQTH